MTVRTKTNDVEICSISEIRLLETDIGNEDHVTHIADEGTAR